MVAHVSARNASTPSKKLNPTEGTGGANKGFLVRPKSRVERDFTQLQNLWGRDTGLKNAARGLLWQLWTHTDGFPISIKGLAENGADGVAAVRTQVEQLEELGYLQRNGRKRNRKGQVTGVLWELLDPFE